MSKAFKIGFGAVLAAFAILIWIGFVATKGNHLAPTGSIGKVRVHGIDDDDSFMVIDFNAKNDSDRDMTVHSIEVTVNGPSGQMTGGSVAAKDLEGAFKSYPDLGEIYNPVLKDRDVIPAHSSVDRMVGARFDFPASQVENRTKLTLRIEDVTGATLTLNK